MKSNDSKAPLGLWSATFLVVANMIGAGIFTTSGFSLGDLGSREYVMLAWFVGGIIALCGAWSYGRLVHLIAESGGEYLFLSRFIHPSAGFVAGWVSLLAGFTGALAFAATTFATYLLPSSLGEDSIYVKLVAIGSVIFFTVIHALHVQRGVWAQNVVVAAKFLLLVAFLGIAAWAFGQGDWEGPKLSDRDAEFSLTSFAGSIVWISLSFSGFNAAVYVASEVKDAKSTVPRALLLGTAIVTVLYLSLNVVFLYAPAPGDIEGQQTVAAIAANAIGGKSLEFVTRMIICLSTLSSVSAMIIAGPRVYAKMADDGVFPSLFKMSKKEGSNQVPTAAILLQAALVCVVVLATGLKKQLDYLGFTLSISAALTVACVFIAMIRRKGGTKEFAGVQQVFAIPAALIYVGATIILALIAVQNNMWQLFAAAITIASGLIFYAIMKLFIQPTTDANNSGSGLDP